MKTFGNIVKILISIAIIIVVVLVVITIVKSISSLSAAFEGESQTVIDATSKNNVNLPSQIVTQIESIIF